MPWLQRWPNSTTLLYQLHRTLLWAGRREEAETIARRYLALVPEGNPVLAARQACARANGCPSHGLSASHFSGSLLA